MTENPRPYGQPTDAQPPPYDPPDQPAPYGAAPAPYGAPPSGQSSKFSVISMVLAGLALLIFPILFGPAAIVLAVMGRNRCEPLARIAFPVAIAATVLGFLITFVLLAVL